MASDLVTLKLLVVGDVAVGKSSLLLRYAEDKFYSSAVSTVGMDLKIKKIELDGRPLKLEIWDSTGQERFRKLMPSYMRGAHGIMVVFDLTRTESFESLSTWMEELNRSIDATCEILVIGNKCDLVDQRAVSEAQAETFCTRFRTEITECSARDATNVAQAFETIVRRILKRRSDLIKVHTSSNVKLSATDSKKDDGCAC